MKILLVSSIQKSNHQNLSRYIDGNAYIDIYCSFNTIKEQVELESGERITFEKIVDLQYSRYDYLNENKQYSKGICDLFDEDKGMQRKIIDLCKQ
jgi:hypothetical protein